MQRKKFFEVCRSKEAKEMGSGSGNADKSWRGEMRGSGVLDHSPLWHNQYIFNIFSIFFQCLFNIFSIYFQCVFNVYSISFQYIFNVFSMYFQYIFNLFSMSFQCLFNIFSIYFQWLFNIFSILFNVFSISFHYLYLELHPHEKISIVSKWWVGENPTPTPCYWKDIEKILKRYWKDIEKNWRK